MTEPAPDHYGRVLECLGEPPGHEQPRNVLDLHRWLLQGLPGTAIDCLGARYGLTSADMSQLLGLKLRTLQRRRKQERLDPTETDRLWRAAVILTEATEWLGSREKAGNWLRRSLRALGGACPLEMLTTEPGYTEVRRVLGRMEWGVWS